MSDIKIKKNKIETIFENIKLNTKPDIYEKLISECGELNEKPTSAKQAKYAAVVMDKLSSYCNIQETEKIMQACNCLSKGTIKKAKKLYNSSKDFSEFLDKLNSEHIGGGSLHIEGNCVIGVYNHCYCSLAKNSKGLSPNYCYCSSGWFKNLFSSVLGRDIEVHKIKTILDGSDKCVFEIYAF